MGKHTRAAASAEEAVRQIVDLDEGRLAVLAGPGSGKTRLLVDRLLRLLNHDTGPREILTLVFNRKAAAELRQRLAETLPDRGFVELRIATFHSFALSLVDRFWRTGGFASRPSLLPSDEQRALIRELLRDHDDGWNVTDDIRTSGSFALGVADAVLRAQEQLAEPTDPVFSAYLRRYRERLRTDGKVDYAGVLARAAVLTEDPSVRQALGVRHLLVDEYQDANLAQEALVSNLATDCRSVVVVGDPFQAIYAFRGASPRLLEQATDRLGAHSVDLTKGHRCPRAIVAASTALVDADPRLPDRGTLEGTDTTGGVAAASFAHRTDELDWVAEHVRALGTDTPWGDIAVLCRSLRTLRAPLQAAFVRAGVPFRIAGGGRAAVHHPWVGPLLGLLDLVSSSATRDADVPAILEAAALSPLVGGEPLALREAFRRARFKDEPEAMLRGWAKDNADHELETLLTAVGAARNAARRGADPATVTWLLWSKLPACARLGEAARDLASIDAIDVDGARAVGAWMQTLVRFVDRNPEATLDGYLDTHDLDHNDPDTWLADREDAAPAVQIMTVHQAKGLTFDHVVVPALEEGNFPAPGRSSGLLDRLGLRTDEGAEERRLLYVALTRARRTVTLTCTTGTEDKMGAAPSRFLADLDDHLKAPADLFGSPGDEPVTVTQARRSWGGILRDPDEPLPERAVAAAGLRALHAHPVWLGRRELEPVRPLRKEPWSLSASSIGGYNDCGRQFLFQRVLQLAPFEPSPAAAFGNAVHAGIQQWIEKDRAAGREALERRLNEAFAALAEPEMPIRAQRESFRRRLPRTAELVADHWWPDIGEPVAVERSIFLKRPDGVKLRARIDLVERVEGGLGIIDWKTGKRALANDPENIQLAVYHHLAREEFGEPIVRLRLAHLRTENWGEQQVTDDHDDFCRRIIDGAVEGLDAERFEIGEKPPCRYCDYTAMCDKQLRGQEPPW